MQSAPLDEFIEDPNQPRKQRRAEYIRDLAESIRLHGQLVPIQVRVENEKKHVLDGHCRLAALRQLQKETADYIVTEVSGDLRLLQYQINEIREGHTPGDKAYLLKALEKNDMPETDIREKMGITENERKQLSALAPYLEAWPWLNALAQPFRQLTYSDSTPVQHQGTPVFPGAEVPEVDGRKLTQKERPPLSLAQLDQLRMLAKAISNDFETPEKMVKKLAVHIVKKDLPRTVIAEKRTRILERHRATQRGDSGTKVPPPPLQHDRVDDATARLAPVLDPLSDEECKAAIKAYVRARQQRSEP